MAVCRSLGMSVPLASVCFAGSTLPAALLVPGGGPLQGYTRLAGSDPASRSLADAVTHGE